MFPVPKTQVVNVFVAFRMPLSVWIGFMINAGSFSFYFLFFCLHIAACLNLVAFSSILQRKCSFNVSCVCFFLFFGVLFVGFIWRLS